MADAQHQLDSTVVHHAWDNTLTPRLWIESGDTVTFEVRGGGDGAFTPASSHADVMGRTFVGHALTGPVSVYGARPGDVLQIEMLELKTWDWGYTMIAPGRGLLPDDFPEPFFQPWDLSAGALARLREDIAVPIEPFHGVLGVAPAAPGVHSTIPPRACGGNLDIKQLTAGSTLWLPIEVEGALFSLGDAHAAQGDGEVCVTAIETGMTSTLRLTVRRDFQITAPQLRTRGRPETAGRDSPWHGTVGVGPDLTEAARDAVRAMIAHLTATYDLSRAQAYVLCSVAVDLKISQIVNAPHWTVTAFLPLDIFDER